MKKVSMLLIWSLVLSSCSVYKEQKTIENYPAKYEYRCVENICKDININYKVERIPKEKYKNLSQEELKNKEKMFEYITDSLLITIVSGTVITTGVNTAINTWGGGAIVGVGTGVLAGLGTFILIGLGALMFPYTCYSEGKEKYYDPGCYIKKQKPEENKKSDEVIKTEPLPASQ